MPSTSGSGETSQSVAKKGFTKTFSSRRNCDRAYRKDSCSKSQFLGILRLFTQVESSSFAERKAAMLRNKNYSQSTCEHSFSHRSLKTTTPVMCVGIRAEGPRDFSPGRRRHRPGSTAAETTLPSEGRRERRRSMFCTPFRRKTWAAGGRTKGGDRSAILPWAEIFTPFRRKTRAMADRIPGSVGWANSARG